ncbi:FAD:protein FMN transferase [Undibacterium sp. TJN19]|uniref:FAD:protein FMN transferase n=1 Tax=Undibacterium sp. TJN19 TaxID=3413055 RepID=UPI003BF134E8
MLDKQSDQAMQIYRIPFHAMACACEVVIAAADQQQMFAIAQEAIAEVRRIEVKYSRYRDDSMVSRINAQAGGQAVECDEETWSLLDYADALYAASDGLFDITAGILRRAWDFRSKHLPAQEELQALCEKIGWNKVERGEQSLRLPQAGMEIDFGGFGKEYAADRAAAILQERGTVHAYLNLGGDIRVLGPKPDGTAWIMGIQDPRQTGKIVASIPLREGALATSGDYEKYFEVEGQRYCHILNPHSGLPVRRWRSISVLAPLTSVAGSCTTIAMLKEADALAYLDAQGMRYLAIDQHGEMHMQRPGVSTAG